MAKKTVLRMKILSALEQQQEMYAHEIAAAIGATTLSVSNAIQAMREIHKIKDCTSRRPIMIYSLQPFEGVIEEVIKEKAKSLARPRRYVPEFKPMDTQAYDLYAGRNLAMLAR